MHEDGYFGERIAAGYDASTGEMGEPGAVDPAVSLLAGLAGGGRALELGIGTGRLALPLARRGSPSTASTSHGPWWPGCGTSQAATPSWWPPAVPGWIARAWWRYM